MRKFPWLEALLYLTAIVAMIAALAVASAPARASAPRCGAEDSASWNWTRCGNRTRGVRDWNGRLRIVTRRTFCRVAIDWSRTPELRGDPSC